MTSELRQRHQATSGQPSKSSDDSNNNNNNNENYSLDSSNRTSSLTELPLLQENGERATENTGILSSNNNRKKNGNDSEDMDGSLMNDSTTRCFNVPNTSSGCLTASEDGGGRGGTSTSGKNNNNNDITSQVQVAKAEGKKRKIVTRVVSGALMIALFLGLVYMGHLYICLLVAMVELLLVSIFFFCILMLFCESWSILIFLLFVPFHSIRTLNKTNRSFVNLSRSGTVLIFIPFKILFPFSERHSGCGSPWPFFIPEYQRLHCRAKVPGESAGRLRQSKQNATRKNRN